MHNEEHLNLVLILDYSCAIAECDLQLIEPNPNKKEINATKKRIKSDIKKFFLDSKKFRFYQTIQNFSIGAFDESRSFKQKKNPVSADRPAGVRRGGVGTENPLDARGKSRIRRRRAVCGDHGRGFGKHRARQKIHRDGRSDQQR